MSETTGKQSNEEFLSQASAREKGSSTMTEFWGFLRHSDKWWMAPIIITILGLGLLVFLAGTGAAPFIYTVF